MAARSTESGPLHVGFAEFELDEANARLSRGGVAVALAPMPFDLLCALMRQPRTLLTKHALLDAVWGHRFVSDSVLKGAISDIRIALGDDARSPRFIETVARRGYRFVAALSDRAPPPAARRDDSSATSNAASGDPGARLQREPSSGFVGREAELAALHAAWDEATRGKRVIAWIAGEPGIGKTTLIEAFRAELGNVTEARGQCLQAYGGSGEPYHALLEALATLARRDPGVAPLLRAVAPTWVLQLPWLSDGPAREALQRELVGVNPERMLREMGELLDRYTEERPLLLVTEDLHWADAATTQLLGYLARRTSPARLMWLSSFRLTEVIALGHPLDALRHELRLHARCVELVLDSFGERDTAAYLAARAPALARDPAFVRALHDRTDGVPLFLASVASELTARREPAEPTVAEVATLPVPRSLSALIEHDFARLDAARRALLTAAAICGVRFRAETLAIALDRGVVDVADELDALAREQRWLSPTRGVAVEPGAGAVPYEFRHALYRQALLDRPTPPARAELHRRVALALEEERTLGATVALLEIATHFEQGRRPMSAARCYAEAARTALEQLSPAECLDLTERALGLLGERSADPDHATIELTLGTLRGIAAFHLFGAGAVARDAFARAVTRLADAPEHPLRGLLLHGSGFLLSLRAEYEEALLTAARAEALGEATDDPLLVVAAATVQGQVHMVQGRHHAARRALERVLPLLESPALESETRLFGFIADPQVTARAMLSLPLLHLGLVADARAHLTAAHARAERLGQPMAAMVALWFDALVATRLEETERVADLAERMRALVEASALAQGRTACQWFSGWAEARRGRPLDGFRRIRSALDANIALGMVSGATETLSYAAEALLAAGEIDAAGEHVEEAIALAVRNDERICLPQLCSIDAAVARARGDGLRAETAARAALDEARAQASPWLALVALLDIVEHADPAAAERKELAALVDQLPQAADTSAIRRARGLLARAHVAPA